MPFSRRDAAWASRGSETNPARLLVQVEDRPCPLMVQLNMLFVKRLVRGEVDEEAARRLGRGEAEHALGFVHRIVVPGQLHVGRVLPHKVEHSRIW